MNPLVTDCIRSRLRRTVLSACALLAGGAWASMASAADATSIVVPAGPVNLTFGGFTALEMVARDHNETADIGSSFSSAIPFPYQVNDPRERVPRDARARADSRCWLKVRTPTP